MTGYRSNEGFNTRVREIGRELFALAEAAEPRAWQSAWWMEQATRVLDQDEALRGRAFQFVDCLPSLRTDADIARHIVEYFGGDGAGNWGRRGSSHTEKEQGESLHSPATTEQRESLLSPSNESQRESLHSPIHESQRESLHSPAKTEQRGSLHSPSNESQRGSLLSLLPMRVALAAVGPGRLQSIREGVVGKAARWGATHMAGRFITGYDVPSAIKTIERLRRQGMAFTLDVLGESTTSYARADEYARIYHQLIDALPAVAGRWPEVPIIDRDASGPMPRMNLSVKLTGMDPHFDAIDPERAIAVVGERLRPLFRHAMEKGVFINVDMESFKHRDLTLMLFKRLLMEDEFRDWEQVGIVLQAYLTDAERDLAGMIEWAKERGSGFAIRLVKGAYWDAETAAAVRNHKMPPVWTRKWETDACYERMARAMLDHAELFRPAFASHNVRSLAVVMAYAEALGLSPYRYELQTLYGMGDPLKHALVGMKRCVRVYCPYGDLMPGMGYLIRRLLENSSNEGFLKQSFGDRVAHERLLADPAIAQPPSAPLPRRYYRNTNPEEPMTTFENASNTNFALEENRRKMVGALDYVRREAGRSYPLVINGESVLGDEWCVSHNPSHKDEVVGKVAQATTTDVDRAVVAAAKAFRVWRHESAARRADVLRRAAEKMEARRFELAATMIREVGKPWREADADVTEAIDHCRYYAEQIERIEARPRLRNLPGEDNMLTYSPKGVCAVIAPWAFPSAILTGMTAAALAAGNTVVMKPARQASVVAAKLVDIWHEAGLPAGVLNFVPGSGSVIGRHLVEHRDVQLVAFTGSSEVGAKVIQAGAVVHAGQGFIKKMIVEMGGKNAIIVDDDADLDGAVQAVIESAFGYAGQKCSSCSRLVVLEGVYEAMCQRLREAVESLPIGPAEEPTTIVGPVIDEAHQARVEEYIAVGQREGRLLVQAKLPAVCGEGFFVGPTVLVDVPGNARIAQEEVFGPVLAVCKAADFEEALLLANDSRYALTGGVFSRSPRHIEQARRDFAVGNLYINRRITGSQVDAQPFGGFKLSGTGVKAGSPDYLLHFMDAHCITENTLRSGFVPQEQHSEVR
jgi:RHH-type transcriptional regulator, proline utilization regulon repressor / proline dehydrogenase / delta 1-pyrroline-5-carboxylate dehydrogenase